LTTLSDDGSSEDDVQADINKMELEMQKIRQQNGFPPAKSQHI
jgi:hypothetical protein